jgi:hypothetical protein
MHLASKGISWDSEDVPARHYYLLMPLTSWSGRLRTTAAGIVGLCLAMAAVLATGTASDDATRLVRSWPLAGSPRCKVPATLPGARRGLVPLIRRAMPIAHLRRRPRPTVGDGGDVAIQDDAPPLGLAEPCGHPPAFEPLGTLSAFLTVARGQADVSRSGSRGPPPTIDS